MTSLMAIIGGTFTVLGLVDGLLHKVGWVLATTLHVRARPIRISASTHIHTQPTKNNRSSSPRSCNGKVGRFMEGREEGERRRGQTVLGDSGKGRQQDGEREDSSSSEQEGRGAKVATHTRQFSVFCTTKTDDQTN